MLLEESDETFYAEPPAGATSTFELPAGRISLGRYERQSGLALSRWDEELALDLAPGERREIEMP